MNINDLKPASNLIQRYGVKMLIYGKAGIGKTPSLAGLPNPVILAVESGLLSLSGSNIPIYDSEGDLTKIVEFFNWLEKSPEAKQFDSVAIDSVSELSTLLLRDATPRFKDPRQAYQESANKCIEWLRMLNSLPSKHVCLVAKLDSEQKSEDAPIMSKPLFEGKKTYAEAVHLFDEVFFYNNERLRGQDGKMGDYAVINTRNSATHIARDRSGKLNPIEPIDLGLIVGKIMS